MIPKVGSEVLVRGIVSDSIDDSDDRFVEVKGWPRSVCVRISAIAELAPEPTALEKLQARRQDFWNVLARWQDDNTYGVDDALRDVAELLTTVSE